MKIRLHLHRWFVIMANTIFDDSVSVGKTGTLNCCVWMELYMITLQKINKTFRVAKRQAGFGRAVKALFSREYETIQALNDVSFTIGNGEMVEYKGRRNKLQTQSLVEFLF